MRTNTEAWRRGRQLPLDDLDKVSLVRGAHPDRSNGLCVMEAAAWVAGRPHSDHPPCVSPIIGTFLRRWNDDLPDDDSRNRLLRPLVPVILNTATTSADEETRAMLVMDWLIRVFTPAWLDAAKLTDEAAALRALPETRETVDLHRAQPVLNQARKRAYAARAAAWAAVGAAAWDAAGAAAWDAAGAAAGDAVRPTSERLQQSAADLVRRMAAVGRE